jgi:Trypsin-co-occurring domain 1
MTGILTFPTEHGEIAVEVDESVARAAGGIGPIAKGGGASGVEIVARSPCSFDEAMVTLKAYAASLDDLIRGLDLTPKEVAVQIGLRMSTSAGFIIAKAGAETDMKISLKWEPQGRSA